MAAQSYDLIGDIHGQHAKLLTVLNTLGYSPRGQFAGWIHPEGRKIIFLGDYINRGPKIREVLYEVRGMVEAGDALAIIGNHEFDAILHKITGASSLPDSRSTQQQFAGRETEWSGWVSWLTDLPLFLDLGDLRAVHACWDARAIGDLGGRASLGSGLIDACLDRETRERKALNRLLFGPVLKVPTDALVLNPRGMPMPEIRVRWWNLPSSPYPIGDLALPESLEGHGMIDPSELMDMPDYPLGHPPVFFGHYWLPRDRAKTPLAANLACLDFGAAAGTAPLVAYRWDGEQVLSSAKFCTAIAS